MVSRRLSTAIIARHQHMDALGQELAVIVKNLAIALLQNQALVLARGRHFLLEASQRVVEEGRITELKRFEREEESRLEEHSMEN